MQDSHRGLRHGLWLPAKQRPVLPPVGSAAASLCPCPCVASSIALMAVVVVAVGVVVAADAALCDHDFDVATSHC